jgi:hypothetical protein
MFAAALGILTGYKVVLAADLGILLVSPTGFSAWGGDVFAFTIDVRASAA